MTDEHRKMLTEMLGECWHEGNDNESVTDGSITIYLRCVKCSKSYVPNRTFTTWDDLGALKDKIVEMGKWGEFNEFVIVKFWSQFGPNDFAPIRRADLNPPLSNWFINPTCFSELVAAWWEERRKG